MALITNLGELQLPAKSFEQLLRVEFNNFDRILSIASSCSEPAQNWKIQLKVQLKDGKTKICSYIMKLPTAPATPNHLKFTNPHAFYEEQQVYYELLDNFEKLYSAASISNQFANNCYQLDGNFNNNNYILLNDLQCKSYRSYSQQFCAKHIQASLKQLAAFHAASAVQAAKMPKRLNNRMFLLPNRSDAKDKWHKLSDRMFQERLKSYNLREYEDMIKTYQAAMLLDSAELNKSDPEDFNVLLLGNFQASNMLFQQDAFGHIRGCILTNMEQAQHRGSPVKDLFNFIFTLPSTSESIKNFDFYIKIYHDALLENLKALKYDNNLPKLTDLQLAVLKYRYWAYLTISKVLPLYLADKFDNDYDTCDEAYEQLKKIYDNPKYAEKVAELLPWMQNRAMLEA